jgi:hypothetical protein
MGAQALGTQMRMKTNDQPASVGSPAGFRTEAREMACNAPLELAHDGPISPRGIDPFSLFLPIPGTKVLPGSRVGTAFR